jgi:DNA-directed RNA polymerase subunit RPC12/RpoP
MTAKELFKKQLNPAPSWNEKSIVFDFDDVVRFAENYHKHKLKLLNIADISNHVVCDNCGDTGREKPTLQEPDGIDCEECSSK